MKILKVKLKELPQVAVNVSEINFDENVIEASSAFERAKRESLAKLKTELHSKIAILSIDDLEFEIIN